MKARLIATSEVSATRRGPNRSVSQAISGNTSMVVRKETVSPPWIAATLQPNASCSGSTNTPSV